MAKITLSGHIIIPESQLEQVQTALVEHIALTQKEAGCLVFRVEQSPTDPCRYDVYEEFVSKIAFEEHQKRVRQSHWGDATQDVARFYSIHEEVD